MKKYTQEDVIKAIGTQEPASLEYIAINLGVEPSTNGRYNNGVLGIVLSLIDLAKKDLVESIEDKSAYNGKYCGYALTPDGKKILRKLTGS